MPIFSVSRGAGWQLVRRILLHGLRRRPLCWEIATDGSVKLLAIVVVLGGYALSLRPVNIIQDFWPGFRIQVPKREKSRAPAPGK